MVEKSEKNPEVESELFALVNSIINLHDKYKEGLINDNFFRKAIKNAMKGLMKINMYFNEKNLSISNVLDKMNFADQYKTAIDIIKKITNPLTQDEKFQNNEIPPFDKKMSYTILELPGITSEITSSFITLMDALKLEGLKSSELILKLFKELIINANKFQGFKGVHQKIIKIYNQVLKNPNNIIENKRFRDVVVEKLYQIFKEFQRNLNFSS
jgi:hypothetical protein